MHRLTSPNAQELSLIKRYYEPSMIYIYGSRRKKTLSPGFADNKGADQPAHPCSLVSAFAIRYLKSKSIVVKLLHAKFQ